MKDIIAEVINKNMVHIKRFNDEKILENTVKYDMIHEVGKKLRRHINTDDIRVSEDKYHVKYFVFSENDLCKLIDLLKE